MAELPRLSWAPQSRRRQPRTLHSKADSPLAAYDYISSRNPNLDRDQKRHLMLDALRGVEIVDGVTRLCAMNLLLHGVGPTRVDEGDPPVRTDDSLRADPGER